MIAAEGDEMPRLARFRLTVLDLAILVAALTPGLAVARHLQGFVAFEDRYTFVAQYQGSPVLKTGWSGTGRERPGPNFDPSGRPLDRRLSYWLMHLPYWGGPCLLSTTLVTLVLGATDLRRRGRAALRQPGMIAAILVTFAAPFLVVEAELSYLVSAPPVVVNWAGFFQVLTLAWFVLPRVAGALVAAAWLALALGGCWGGERAGREPLRIFLGAAWIAAGAACQLGIWGQELNL